MDSIKPSRVAFEHFWLKTRGENARDDLKLDEDQPQVYPSAENPAVAVRSTATYFREGIRVPGGISKVNFVT